MKVCTNNMIAGSETVCIYYTNNLDSRYAAGWVYRYAKTNGVKNVITVNTHFENLDIPKNPVNNACAVICGAIPHMKMFDEVIKAYMGKVLVFENSPTYINYLKMYNWNPKGLIYANISIAKLVYLFLYENFRMDRSDPWNKMMISDRHQGLVSIDCRNYPNFKSSALSIIDNHYPYIKLLDRYEMDKFIDITDIATLYYLYNEFAPFTMLEDPALNVGYIRDEKSDTAEIREKGIIYYRQKIKNYITYTEDMGAVYPVKLHKFEKYDAVAFNSIDHDPEIFRHKDLFKNFHIGIIYHMEYDQMYYSLYRLKKDETEFIDIGKICTSFGGRGNANSGSFIINNGTLQFSLSERHP